MLKLTTSVCSLPASALTLPAPVKKQLWQGFLYSPCTSDTCLDEGRLQTFKRKAAVIFERTINSHASRNWLIGAATVLSNTCSAVAWTLWLKNINFSDFTPNTLTTLTAIDAAMKTACSLFLYSYSQKHAKQYDKQIVNESALTRNLVSHLKDPTAYPWFSTIVTNKLTLGGLPLANFGHEQQLKDCGITAILSVNEKEEFQPRSIAIPFCPKKDNNWKLLEVSDHSPVGFDQLKEAVDWIEAKIQDGKHVYLHCKSGKGRSVMIALIWMHVYGGKHDPTIKSMIKKLSNKSAKEKIDALIAHLKTLRPQINPNKEQTEVVVDYIQKNSKRDPASGMARFAFVMT